MEMQDNDYLTFIGEYRNKLAKLLELLNRDPVKYGLRIVEVKAMIGVVDYLKDEYYKSIINNLQETRIFSTMWDKV